MSEKPPEISELKYEQAVERLERIVEQIESGQIGLEDALQQYEQGMALIQRCRAILSTAEQRIAELTADENGELELRQPGDPSDDGQVD